MEGLLEEQLELALGLGRHGAVRHVEARGVVRQRPQAPGLEVPAAQGPLEGRREVAALLACERHEAADLARDLLAVVLGVALVARARVAAPPFVASRLPALLDGVVEEMRALLRAARDDALALAMNDVPLGRMGQPEESAGMVAWLVSADARGVTGQTLDMNGGAFML